MSNFKSSVANRVNASKDYLVEVNVELYPEEIIAAAQQALGTKVLSDYFVEIYNFAYAAKNQNIKIQANQLNGVLLTHKKIEKWLATMQINDVFDLNNPAVLKTYLQFHIASMKHSVAIFEFIASSLGE